MEDRFSFSFWDSLNVSAAKVARWQLLLSEHFQTGKSIDGLLVINPFLTDPESI